ncbi:hypothetical protein Q762_06390 [Flavobacterium cauense R2A-7]|nr:hypothetical protein Q762_06390 [Flavobacterium cauense R2A-7]
MKSDFCFHNGNLLIIIQFKFLSNNKQDVHHLNRIMNRLIVQCLQGLSEFSETLNLRFFQGLDFSP